MSLKPNPDNTIILKAPSEIAIMREAGKVVAAVAQTLEQRAEPGMSTQDLNEIAKKMFDDAGAESTAFGYFDFPGHICVSVNNEVVHGIPGSKKLKRGDLVKCDIAARYRGYVGDTTACFGIGGDEALAEPARELKRVTKEALFKGIEAAQPGNRLTDIGAAIEEHVRKNGMSVVREFVGHGIGRAMHEAPQVYHYGPGGRGPVLRPGMCLAIEPQVNLGSAAVRMLEDHWTAVTMDGKLSAHLEHTIAITANGPEILTLIEAPVNGQAH
jgi:methionyl aminopeptidase